jgi:hypothetical protein
MRGALLALALLTLASCSDNRQYAHAVSVLVDVSGTYADQRDQVVELIKKGIVPSLLPGDSLTLIVIDGESYEKDNVEASLTLDLRPSHANAQKLALAKHLDAFAEREIPARFTDIQGAIMLAADHLRETGARTQTIVAFSDMKEDLPTGYERDLASTEFDGMRIAAVNVKQLQGDNSNPGAYRDRLGAWERRVTESGATEWKVIVDGAKLAEYMENRS